MGSYDNALVCENGHVINSSAQRNPEFSSKHCSTCGSKAVDRCSSCGRAIKGEYHVEGVLVAGVRWQPPNHCHECGTPYPWTKRKADALLEAIQELDELKPEERERLAGSVPDIISNTPKSETAGLRFKKAIAKLGAGTAKFLKDALMSAATEALKKSMGLG